MLQFTTSIYLFSEFADIT